MKNEQVTGLVLNFEHRKLIPHNSPDWRSSWAVRRINPIWIQYKTVVFCFVFSQRAAANDEPDFCVFQCPQICVPSGCTEFRWTVWSALCRHANDDVQPRPRRKMAKHRSRRTERRSLLCNWSLPRKRLVEVVQLHQRQTSKKTEVCVCVDEFVDAIFLVRPCERHRSRLPFREWRRAHVEAAPMVRQPEQPRLVCGSHLDSHACRMLLEFTPFSNLATECRVVLGCYFLP